MVHDREHEHVEVAEITRNEESYYLATAITEEFVATSETAGHKMHVAGGISLFDDVAVSMNSSCLQGRVF